MKIWLLLFFWLSDLYSYYEIFSVIITLEYLRSNPSEPGNSPQRRRVL